MDIITILNTIRANNDVNYQNRVPEATQANLTEVGTAIINYEPAKNAFIDAIINKIAFTVVSNRAYKNPLSVLKTGTKPFGTDIEDIYTNPVSAVKYEGTEIGDMLKITKPDTKTIYYRTNRQDKYPISINDADLTRAFVSAGNMSTFINSVITALYAGDEIDEFLLMKNAINTTLKAGNMVTVSVDYDGGETTSKDLVKAINTVSGELTFPSSAFNGYSLLNAEAIAAKTVTPCRTWTPRANQVLLIRNDVDVATDVEVLAKAFNMNKTDFEPRKIVLDDLGTDKDGNEVLAVVADEALFRFYDDLYKTATFVNGSNLVTNYWLHHWQTLSLSLFANAVAFTKKAAA